MSEIIRIVDNEGSYKFYDDCFEVKIKKVKTKKLFFNRNKNDKDVYFRVEFISSSSFSSHYLHWDFKERKNAEYIRNLIISQAGYDDYPKINIQKDILNILEEESKISQWN